MSLCRLSACSLALVLALSGPVWALSAQDIAQASFTAPDPATKPPANTTPPDKKPVGGKAAKAAGKSAGKADAGKLDPLVVKAQVLLARKNVSPGEIDGHDGENYRKALAQFRRLNGLGEGDQLDAATWAALGGPTAGDVITTYAVTKADAATSFVRKIPHDYAKQARLKRLGYTSPAEMFAERFHMSPKLFLALNPQAGSRKAKLKPGETLTVVATQRAVPLAPVARLEANKGTGMLVAYGADDAVLASYPATIGNSETPSPEGEHTITRVVRNPPYEYDPQKNFQQGRNTKRLALAPGPNNPVGTVWIALSKPTFGIHGTPEPAQVSKTSSHGCVRLTNWDAEDLAGLVKPGVKVRFVEKPGA